jgi:hypothetical protein
METLLMVAVVLIALAIIVQAGVLVTMYLMSRKLTEKVNGLIEDSRTLMGPLETVTLNLKQTSNELAEVGKIAHAQAHQIEATLNETRETIRTEVEDLRDRVFGTVDDVRHIIMRPIRHSSAFAHGVAEGLRTFFGRTRTCEPAQIVKQETPAA